MIASHRPRIFWFEAAYKWAISADPLSDRFKAQMFMATLRQECRAIFNETVRAWMIDDAHLGAAKKLIEKYYGKYEFVPRERPRAETPPLPPPQAAVRIRAPAYVVFCSLVGCDQGTNLSYDRARALYRHAAARLHPDTGGSSDDMAALNVAWLAVRDMLS
jgi:hypothetical protein